MLRYKTETRPGLVALYDIWPRNGAGPFLQPRSPHGALFPRNYIYRPDPMATEGMKLLCYVAYVCTDMVVWVTGRAIHHR